MALYYVLLMSLFFMLAPWASAFLLFGILWDLRLFKSHSATVCFSFTRIELHNSNGFSFLNLRIISYRTPSSPPSSLPRAPHSNGERESLFVSHSESFGGKTCLSTYYRFQNKGISGQTGNLPLEGGELPVSSGKLPFLSKST